MILRLIAVALLDLPQGEILQVSTWFDLIQRTLVPDL